MDKVKNLIPALIFVGACAAIFFALRPKTEYNMLGEKRTPNRQPLRTNLDKGSPRTAGAW